MVAALRGAVLVGLGLVICRFLLRGSASQRHLLLASTLALALLLPGLDRLAPEVPLAVLPALDPGVGAFALLALVWLVGFLGFAVARLVGYARLREFQAEARPLDGPLWRSVIDTLRAELGIRRDVRLVVHPLATTPATWGVWHPVILLPLDALAWSADRRRAVLLHELGHVRRLDVLVHHAATFVCALHWFDPLVWLAVRGMRREREKACDDLVLAAGGRPSGYAATLLGLVRRMRAASLPLHAAAAFGLPGTARGASELEHRLTHLLDPMTRHTRLTPLRAATTLLAAFVLALSTAGLQLVEDETPVRERATSEARDHARTGKESARADTDRVDTTGETKADTDRKATTDAKATADVTKARTGAKKGATRETPKIEKRVWSDELPTAEELAKAYPGLSHRTFERILEGGKLGELGKDGGIAGLADAVKRAKLARGKLDSKDVERLVEEALEEFQKQVGIDVELEKTVIDEGNSRVILISGSRRCKQSGTPKKSSSSSKDSSSSRDSGSSSSSDSSSSSSGSPTPKRRAKPVPKKPAPAKPTPGTSTPTKPVPKKPAPKKPGPVELSRLERSLQSVVLYPRTWPKGDYVRATYSFWHGTRDDVKLTRNNWDLQIAEDSRGRSSLRVNMVTDDRSGIVDLGEQDLAKVSTSTRSLAKHRLGDNLPVVKGHAYLIHTKDTDTNFWTLIKIVDVRPDRSVQLIWRVVRNDGKRKPPSSRR